MFPQCRNIKITQKLMLIENNSKKHLIFTPYHFGVHQKLKIIKENITKYKLILIPHQFGIHWWINIFVKLKIYSYLLKESYLLVSLDSMIDRNQNNELQVKNI